MGNVLLVGVGGFLGSPAIDDNITEGLATLEKVDVRLYRSRPVS